MLDGVMTLTDTTITMRRPDDFHLHVRQGPLLTAVVPHTSRAFARALIMPNTVPPVLTLEDVKRYRNEVIRAGGIPAAGTDAAGSRRFEPLMTFKITERSGEYWNAERLRQAREAGLVAAKLYPEGATTNSSDGVRDVRSVYPVFEMMEESGVVLAIHGEDPSVFSLEREAAFLPHLHTIARDFPDLRIVLEHVSSREGVDSVLALPDSVCATVTLHHLVLTLDDVAGGLLNPHNFCKPVVKTPRDRDALRSVVFSGNPKFFFGSDSAPHLRSAKESDHGSAGVFSAPVLIPALVELFLDAGAIERLEPFIASFGADFYQIPRNSDLLTVRNREWRVPPEYDGVVPFRAGERLAWSIET